MSRSGNRVLLRCGTFTGGHPKPILFLTNQLLSVRTNLDLALLRAL